MCGSHRISEARDSWLESPSQPIFLNIFRYLLKHSFLLAKKGAFRQNLGFYNRCVLSVVCKKAFDAKRRGRSKKLRLKNNFSEI